MKRLRLFLPCMLIFLTQGLAFSGKDSLPSLVKKVKPGVVSIITYDQSGSPLAQGSGFFISCGRAVTNRHVIEGAFRAQVKTSAGEIYPISGVVADSQEWDLAIILVDLRGAPVAHLKMGNTVPQEGECVVVIGSPLGLEGTISEGIVSAVREIPGLGEIMQITAPISRGSSGGPVLNLDCEVIGVATVQLVEGQNLNFAVPAAHVKALKPGKAVRLPIWDAFPGAKIQEWCSHRQDGLNALWAGEYATALRLLEEAVRANPSDALGWVRLAGCYLLVSEHQKALDACKEAMRIDTDLAEAHFVLGLVYMDLGQNEAAAEAFELAIGLKPHDAVAHYVLGCTYFWLGRYEVAVQELKQSIRLRPDCADVHRELGRAYTMLGQHRQGSEAFQEAIRLKPDDAEAHLFLGMAYGFLNQYQQALEPYKEAIRLNPDYAEAHLHLAAAYSVLGQHKVAVQAFKEAIRLKPDYANAHFELGLAYCGLGQWRQAVPPLNQAVRLKPDDAEAHYWLGRCYLMISDVGSALDEYKILKDLDEEWANELFKAIYP